MTNEIKELLEAAAKIKQICQESDGCDKCPFKQEFKVQDRFAWSCRFYDNYGDGVAPFEWVLDWEAE